MQISFFAKVVLFLALYCISDISIKNTQTWLKETDPKVLNDIKRIEKKLENWCYDFK